jgi:hypothetical protein
VKIATTVVVLAFHSLGKVTTNNIVNICRHATQGSKVSILTVPGTFSAMASPMKRNLSKNYIFKCRWGIIEFVLVANVLLRHCVIHFEQFWLYLKLEIIHRNT